MAAKRVTYLALRVLLAKPLTYWQLIKAIDVDLPTTQASLKTLLKEGLIEYKNGLFYITDKGKEKANSLGLSPFDSLRCPTCQGRTVTLERHQSLLKEFETIVQKRPKAISEYDQGYVTPADTISRVLFMYEVGDVEGKDILLLGDDDLTSLALLASGWPRRVTVLEIDTRILDFIEKVAKEKGWSVETIQYDARYPIEESLKGQFDVFLTDPVETIGGLRLFLSRCVEGLRGEGCVGYFGLTHLEASRRKWRQIQRDILDMGFTITDIVRNFQTYLLERDDVVKLELRVAKEAPVKVESPEVDFYTSNLFRLYAVEKPQPLVKGKVDWKRELYYDGEAYVTCP